MSPITINQIKKLREKTGGGIMDCRRALGEAGGNIKRAEELLRERGIEKAEKKAAEREVKAGRVFAYVHHTGRVGAMVAIGTETDFVARLDEVKLLGEEVAKQVAAMDPASLEELLSQAYIRDPNKSIDELIKGISGKTGEKIVVVEFKRLSV